MPEFRIRVMQTVVESKTFTVEAENLESALAVDPDVFANEIGTDDFAEVESRWIEEG